MVRFLRVLSYIFLGFSTILFILPFLLYWMIHGDYARYVWLINGPNPLHMLGSGPFQLWLYTGSIFSAIVCLLAALFLWRKSKRISKIDKKVPQ